VSNPQRLPSNEGRLLKKKELKINVIKTRQLWNNRSPHLYREPARQEINGTRKKQSVFTVEGY